MATIQTGGYSSDTSGTGEWDLDTQSILGMAGGRVQQLRFYNEPTQSDSHLTTAFNTAVYDGRAKIVNVSLGICEIYSQRDGSQNADDQIFMAANAQGMMFSVSSGDSGSHECNTYGPKTRANAVQSYPASSPYVVAVGGTTLNATPVPAGITPPALAARSLAICTNTRGITHGSKSPGNGLRVLYKPKVRTQLGRPYLFGILSLPRRPPESDTPLHAQHRARASTRFSS